MYSTKKLLMLLLSIGAVLFLVTACGGGEDQAASDSEQGGETEAVNEEAEAAFQEAIAAYQATNDPEERLAIVGGFAEKYPDTDNGISAINYVASTYYASIKEDLEAGIAYANEMLTKIENPDRQKQMKLMIMGLYAGNGDVENMQAIIADVSSGELGLDDHSSIASAAIEAGLADVAIEHANQYLARSTAERIKADNADRELSEDRIESMVKRNKANGYTLLASAQLASDSLDEAMASFELAGEYTTFNYVDVPMSNLNVEWAEALIKKGDYQAAMERVAPDAILQGKDEAKEVFKKAYLETGGSEESLEATMEEWRLRLAKEVADFTAFTYEEEGTPVTYESMKGEVTLLAFFFPT